MSEPERPVRVIVFGATGGLGQRVWRAAVDADHDVVVFVRSPNKLDTNDPRHERLSVFVGDAMDAGAVREASEGCRVAINCTSPAGGDATLDLARAIVPNAAGAGVTAFYMVGGLGALWAPGTNRTTLVQDWDDREGMLRHGLRPDMPREMIRRMTAGHLASMAYLAETGHRHAFVCPGMMSDGPASESQQFTLDELGGEGVLHVSFDDIANAIVGDLAAGAFLGHRVCVAPRRLE